MVPPLRLSHLVAIVASALLVAVAGLVAGFAARGGAGPEPPPHAWCPAPSSNQTPGPGRCAGPVGGTSLRDLAEPRRLKLGSAVNTGALPDERYRTVLAREFSAVTAENVMKWSAVEPVRGVYDRAEADQLIAFAREHDQQVYGHTLVWHQQVPAWVTEGSFDDSETSALLREHVQDEVSYFRGRVWAWDVVNEAFSQDGTLRDSLWLRRLGEDYIADAFRWARAADPEAKLFINDFGTEAVNPKSDALHALVTRLLAEGVPIDGVGFQVHWTLDPLPGSFADNLRRFTALGLDVAITEMDARMPEPATPARLQRQADVYAQAITTCLSVPRCVSFTVWGFTDAHSWVPRAVPGSGAATMFDADLNPKPAYAAVADALGGAGPEDVDDG